MDEKTLEALKGSIAKWEAIAAGTGHDDGTENCPLCQMFHPDHVPNQRLKDYCGGCPVKEKTGSPGCNNTPYTDHSLGWNDRAKAELEFLKSLLPATLL